MLIIDLNVTSSVLRRVSYRGKRVWLRKKSNEIENNTSNEATGYTHT
jgi:hypothetical protein